MTPTLLAACGVAPPPVVRMDGVNLLPLLSGQVATEAWATLREDGAWELDGTMPISELKARLDMEAQRFHLAAGGYEKALGLPKSRAVRDPDVWAEYAEVERSQWGSVQKIPDRTAAGDRDDGGPIGWLTAIFTIVNQLVFKPLSGRAGNLSGLYSRDRESGHHRAFSYANYADIREQSDVFESLMAHTFARAGTPAGDTTRPVLDRFTITRRRFAVGPKATALTAAATVPTRSATNSTASR